MFYNAFHADFGPYHIGHLYRFAVHFHEILGDPANSDRAVVFYSKTDAKSRANAACLVACYMVLIQSWPPHLALAPIAQADPPYMPFRDAGYSQADFILTIQDVVYGVWKAKEQSLCGLREFNLEEYVSSSPSMTTEILTIINSGTRSMNESTWVTSIGLHRTSSPLPLHNTTRSPRFLLPRRNTRPCLPPSPKSLLPSCLSLSRMSWPTLPREMSGWSFD